MDNNNNNNNHPLRIALFPWLAFGHLMPFLHLAKLLARKGHSIYFLSTRANLERLPKTPPDLATRIHMIHLSLPPTPGLLPGAESTADISYDQMLHLKLAFDGLQPQIAAFLESSLPHWLILDFAPYWALPIASKLGVRTAFFSIFNASTLAFIGPVDNRKDVLDWTVKPKWVPFESDMAFRHHEVVKMVAGLEENITGITDGERMTSVLRECDVIAPRSCHEFAPEWLTLLADICKKPVVPVGLLLPKIEEDTTQDTWLLAKEWLDGRPRRSVVYVAFGSESTLTREELSELALGLEMSGLPFFWVLRTQEGDLPDGFRERTRESGVVWTRWAPQLKILSHGSVGGYLGHAGWSSSIEAIMHRKPMVLLPLFSDQGLFARLLAEKRLGYPIPRDESDGTFTRNAVADSVRMVVVEEEGKVYRENVEGLSGVFRDTGRQEEYVDNFAKYLQTHVHGTTHSDTIPNTIHRD